MIGKTSRLLTLLIVSGCATTEPLPEFYTLGPGGDIHSQARQSAARSVQVYVNRAILPAYLGRTNLASFRNNQIEYSSYAFWAAPLDQAIAQAVALNLNVFGITAIGFQPMSSPPAHSYEIFIRVIQFAGYEGGEVVFSGTWELRFPGGGVIARKSFAIHRSGWRPGHHSSLAMLLADEVTELTKQIVAVLHH